MLLAFIKQETEKLRNNRIIKGLHLYSFGLLRRIYDWVISWAYSKYSSYALFFLAFCESFFFPVPPDVLLMSLSISRPKKAWFYAFISSLGSVIGAFGGFLIGYLFFETIGASIINGLGYGPEFIRVGTMYKDNAFFAITTAAFTPIPFKVFTIAAGVWKVSLSTLFLASLIGRSGRFFLVGGLIYFFGPRIKTFIDKYFNLLTLVFFALVIAGFYIVKLLA
ncbi:MAG: VTT domain-containing protein [Nanoarchaeota archaeon]|nr:VTT domain-containing protein [Nanoarchaeota archaeon]